MAAALQCDVCKCLYKTYTVKPQYYQWTGPASRSQRIILHAVPGTEVYAGDAPVDLCGPCLSKVVEEYLKAIPTEA